MRILVLDCETSWIRSLFEATPPDVNVDFLGVLNIRERQFKKDLRLLGMLTYERIDGCHTAQYLWSITRLERLTRLWLKTYMRFRFPMRQHDAVVFTNPLYAHLLACFKNQITVYYAYDPFEFYPHLARRPIRALEQTMLDKCHVVAAVSKRLTLDFEARSGRPAAYIPNATLLKWLAPSSEPRPDDIPTGKPVVGCTGQINATYDWPLIAAVTQLRPDFNFVFVGPVVEGDSQNKQEIDRIFERPNVFWLGAKPHEQLRRYMNAFDVCFCPLVANEHNDRRSPLRLYDYLTTDKPIISTRIAEAFEHVPHVAIVADGNSFSEQLMLFKLGKHYVDKDARRAYMKKHTWEARAGEMIEVIRQRVEDNSLNCR